MPNIRSQKVDASGITIVASNGKSSVTTAAQILAHYLGTTGSVAARRAATILWLEQKIELNVGAEMVPQSKITVDFNEGNGQPSSLRVDS